MCFENAYAVRLCRKMCMPCVSVCHGASPLPGAQGPQQGAAGLCAGPNLPGRHALPRLPLSHTVVTDACVVVRKVTVTRSQFLLNFRRSVRMSAV